MDDLQIIRRAADIAGVDRKTIGRWLKSGKLVGKKKLVGNLMATLVSVKACKALKESRGRSRKG